MWFKFQQCLFCGAFNRQPSGFCSHCFKFFSCSPVLFQNKASLPNHYYVLNWTKDKTAPVDLLIKELKANPSNRVFQYWGKLLATECLKLDLDGACIVPAAAKKPGTFDHAFALAQILSSQLQLPISNVLRRKDTKSAKSLSKSERASSISFYSENFSHPGDILFVDDVLTTGTTALESIKALNTKKKVHIVTLANRLFL